MGFFFKSKQQPIQIDQINLKNLSKSVSETTVLVSDFDQRKRLERIADNIRYSEPSTKTSINKLEREIEKKLNEIKKAYETKKLANIESLLTDVEQLIIERNNNAK